MRFKKAKLLLVLTCIALAAAGCSDDASSSGQQQSKTAAREDKIVIPQEEPDLIGIVKEVVGNEVTLAKMQPGSNRRPGQRSSASDSNRGDSAPKAENIKTPPPTPAAEETEIVTIPVGATLVGMSRGEAGASAISLTDIKENQLIRMWKTNNTISLVQVMGGAPRQRNQNGREPREGPPGGPGGFGNRMGPGRAGGGGFSQSIGGGR